MSKFIGLVSAYAYAKSKGYTGTEEEFAILMAEYASVTATAVEAVRIATESAQSAAAASSDVNRTAATVTQQAAQIHDDAETSSENARTTSEAKETAVDKALDSEAYALGTRDGEDVGSSDPAYHNNAKWYAEQTESFASQIIADATAQKKAAQTAQTAAEGSATTAQTAAQTATTKAAEAAESARTLTIDPTLTQSGQAADSKVVGDKIAEVKSDLDIAFVDSPNLFDKSNIVTGKTLLGSSGHTINDFQDATNWCVSNIFNAHDGQTFIFNSYFDTSVARVCFYDSDGNYLVSKYATANDDGTYSVSCTGSDVQYGRFVYKTTILNADTFMLVAGTTMPDEYVPFGTTLNPSYVSKQIDEALDAFKPTVSTNNIVDKAVTQEKTAFIVHDPETNYIDANALIYGKYINKTGAEVSTNNWYCTGYIPLEAGKTYYINDYVYKSYYGFYDVNLNVVGCSQDNGDILGSVTIPTDAVYGRFSFNGAINAQNLAYISVNSGKPKNYGYMLAVSNEIPTEYSGNDISTFNRILCIGDSITFGGYNSDTPISAEDKALMSAKYSYPTALEKITGVSVTNKGDSGKTTSTWYANHSADDLSGHDCCIIELGINDETWDSTSETAMTNIINKVKTENSGIKIFVSTIPPGQSYVSNTYKAISTGIRNYVDSLNDNDVILLDEAIYGHLQSSRGYNAGHLTAYGYWRLAKDYANYISWYMNGNRDSFRFVQFTGTNYSYSN